jgi:hypothetical protein
MNSDLGTYHIRVQFTNGTGYLCVVQTGRRYTEGAQGCHPLDAEAILPPFTNEEELFSALKYQHLEGNHSCDCNRLSFLASVAGQPLTESPPCGHTLELQTLTAIRPDGTEHLLWKQP